MEIEIYAKLEKMIGTKSIKNLLPLLGWINVLQKELKEERLNVLVVQHMEKLHACYSIVDY